MLHKWTLIILILQASAVLSLPQSTTEMSVEYFVYKDVRHLCYMTCDKNLPIKQVVKEFMNRGIRISVYLLDDRTRTSALEVSLKQWNIPVGVLLDGTCEHTQDLFIKASRVNLFDSTHIWFVIVRFEHDGNMKNQLEQQFMPLNLSIDADIVVASYNKGGSYDLSDVFNYGKIQGNKLEVIPSGTWSSFNGLTVFTERFKYYNRWNFRNLTLRAVSVILDQPKVFAPEMLTDLSYTAGVSAMTKIVAQLLNVLMERHNFRFNYTIVGRWIGSPVRNSTLAVTNSLYWGDQDISCTCARIFPKWLNWVDIFFPAVTKLETKFYYLIPDKGVGDYENRFLTPMSPAVWWCACLAAVFCVVILAAAAKIERRPEPGFYALFSVFAASCQQEYEDGMLVTGQTFSSQGRRIILLVIGLTSMLLYNYYTSSVVSWLLNAAAPTLEDLDALMNSDLELVFEDIGYTRGWLDNPGFFYYSGYKNTKEDELRDKKVIKAKRTVPLLQTVSSGTELVRTGAYAYHTEPYSAYQAISKTFDDTELCKLGSLQMMQPAQVYVMAQKHSPYKQFFIWSLMRLQERGHVKASQGRVSGGTLECSGRIPRALSLGQAAPAFILLCEMTALAILLLTLEILWHRFSTVRRTRNINKKNKFRGSSYQDIE